MIDEREELSEIQKFYSGTNILITGGTGFIGKLIVEKLLRTCWLLNKIYLIVRPKKGKTYEERLEDLFKSQAFKKLHEYNPNFKEQVVIINGNLEDESLGLSKTDWDLLAKEINIVIHCAATVRFDEKILKAAHMNVRATKDIITLAHSMKNLTCFTYISTAYSNMYLKEIEEKIYDAPFSCSELFKFIEGRSDEELDNMTPKLIGKYPNTYVFTKAIAEEVVAVDGEGLPRVIIRPTIVTSSYQEPTPGWIDTYYGPITMTILVGLGVLHPIPMRTSKITDLIPVDFVVNHILASTFYKAKKTMESNNEISVFTCCSSAENPVAWKDYGFWIHSFFDIAGANLSVWFSWYFFVQNRMLYSVLSFVLDTIPAYFIDFILKCIGREPVVKRIVDKAHKISHLLIPFMNNEWVFHNSNTKNMLRDMSYKDRRLFNFDVNTLDWLQYFFSAFIGGRRNLLNEKLFYPKDYHKGIFLKNCTLVVKYAMRIVLIFGLIYILKLAFLKKN